jgi:uncharacterized spore protein YtfJ
LSDSNGSVQQTLTDFFAAFERAQKSASVKAVYGEPIVYEDKVVLPIATITHGFGIGGGVGSDVKEDRSDEGVGGGGVGYVGAHPIALAEINADGVKVTPIVDENRALAAGLAFAAWAVFWTARTLIKIFK